MSATAHPVARAFAWHRPLMTLAAAMAALALACAVGLVVDDRTVTGLPVWDKPLKFALSTLIYGVTWAWLISLVREHRPARSARSTSAAGTVAAVLLGVELVIIVGQAARGETSHFNQTTALDSALYRIMAVSIVAVWLATLAVTVQLFRVRGLDRARTLALRAGAALALVGMAAGFLMTSPTRQQIETDSDIVGAHTVGLPDGGPGLPFLGWSTVGGDLRIPHFVGMHALQAIPLVLIALELLAPRVPALRDVVVRRRLVATAAGAYAALLVLLTWQALRGQSIVAPDGVTLTAAAATVVATVVAAVLALRSPRPAPAEPPRVPAAAD
jgi:hypothetical protein